MPFTNQALVSAMESHGFNVKHLAAKVGVTPASVYHWLHGGVPQGTVRHELIKVLERDEAELRPTRADITVKISGDGFQIATNVSKETARKLVHQLLNED
jgi:transcriptional regulator with XRE-family HTH domain